MSHKKKKIRLGFNVDHVATVRNARGESYPSPVQAAALAELGGADNITCHLREDRRHIRESDVLALKETINIPLNFEMAATDEMLAIAKKVKPFSVTLVPEKREELTTEGGLDLQRQKTHLEGYCKALKDEGILVSLFVDSSAQSMEQAYSLGADAVEIHTGDFCHELQNLRRTQDQMALVKPLQDVACLAHEMGLQVHFGHGLNYSNAHWMQWIPHCEEVNIGHAIVGRAIFVGLVEAVSQMKSLLNDGRYEPKRTL